MSGLGKGSTLNTRCTNKPYGVEWRRGLSDAREKHCTCPSCSPPTWPSVQRPLHECREHSLASKVPLLFSSLCSSPRPEPRINISKHVSCLHPPPLSLYASPPSFAPMIPPPPTSSLTHSPFPVHHLFSSILPPTSNPPNLPACLPACLLAEMCDIFPYLMFCCSSAPLNPITSAVCFMD